MKKLLIVFIALCIMPGCGKKYGFESKSYMGNVTSSRMEKGVSYDDRSVIGLLFKDSEKAGQILVAPVGDSAGPRAAYPFTYGKVKDMSSAAAGFYAVYASVQKNDMMKLVILVYDSRTNTFTVNPKTDIHESLPYRDVILTQRQLNSVSYQ